jgi:hypothetical protein
MVYEYFSIVWIVLRYALMMVYEIWYNFYEKLRCDKWFVFKLWCCLVAWTWKQLRESKMLC